MVPGLAHVSGESVRAQHFLKAHDLRELCGETVEIVGRQAFRQASGQSWKSPDRGYCIAITATIPFHRGRDDVGRSASVADHEETEAGQVFFLERRRNNYRNGMEPVLIESEQIDPAVDGRVMILTPSASPERPDSVLTAVSNNSVRSGTCP